MSPSQITFFIENWSKVSLPFVKTAMEQSEKLLAESIKAGEGISEKAHKILAIDIAIITACLIYVFSDKTQPIFVFSACNGMALCFISILYLIKPIKTYDIYPCGSPPKLMLIEKFINGFSSPDSQVKNLLFNECIEYQKRITFNLEKNIKRTRAVDLAMFILLALPLTLFLGWLCNRYFLG
jgi:hypothetical protein